MAKPFVKNTRTRNTSTQREQQFPQHDRDYVTRAASRLTALANQAIWDTYGTVRGARNLDPDTMTTANVVYEVQCELAHMLDDLVRGPDYRSTKMIARIEEYITNIPTLWTQG